MLPALNSDHTVRALITTPVDEREHQVCSNIKAKQIEAITTTFIVAEIPKTDFEKLRREHSVSEIAKIPPKEALPFPLPSSSGYYDMVIPGPLLCHWKRQLQDLGVQIQETLPSESGLAAYIYLVYLTPDQVRSVYELPFVHSIRLHRPVFDKASLAKRIDKEAIAIYFEFHPQAKEQVAKLMKEFAMQCTKMTDQECWLTIHDLSQMAFLDELLRKPYVRDIFGCGEDPKGKS